MNISNDPDLRIPPNWRRLSEAGWLLSRAWHGIGHLDARGPVDGPPALVIPGFIANDRTTMALRRALAEAGFRTYPWNGGWNMGARADTIARLVERLNEVSPEQPVLVVGWSLGGVFARELARAAPGKVRAVVTLGSPFSQDPHLNNVWRIYEWVAGHPVDQPPIERISSKPPVPTLAFWSRKDGIIAPAAARGAPDETDKAVEFDCNHMAFGCSARTAKKVVEEIQRFLAEHPARDSKPTSP